MLTQAKSTVQKEVYLLYRQCEKTLFSAYQRNPSKDGENLWMRANAQAWAALRIWVNGQPSS